VISVVNPLRGNSTVVPNVELLVKIKLLNAYVNEPKTGPFDIGVLSAPTAPGRSMDPVFESEGDVVEAEEIITPEVSDQIAVTAEETVEMQNKPSTLDIGRKFEHCPQSIVEILRRFRKVSIRTLGTGQAFSPITSWAQDLAPLSRTTTGTQVITAQQAARRKLLYSFLARPRHPILKMYAAFSGQIKYRIIVSKRGNLPNTIFDGAPKVSFFPFPPLDAAQGNGTQIWSFWAGLVPAGTAAITGGGSAPAVEVFSGLPDGSYFVDVQIPFSTHYNCVPIGDNDIDYIDGPSGIPTSLGWVSVELPFGTGAIPPGTGDVPGVDNYTIDVYEAVAMISFRYTTCLLTARTW